MMSNLEEADEGVSSRKVLKVVQTSTITKLAGILYKDRALHAQAHFFIFSSCAPPFSIFNDSYFRNMLVGMIPKGPGYLIVEKPPVLSIPLLKKIY